MGKRKVYIGNVIGNKMDKTCIVAVERVFSHPRYKKIIRQVRKLKVHDEKNGCNPGDTVRIVEARPISKEKRWVVAEIMGKSRLEMPGAAAKEA